MKFLDKDLIHKNRDQSDLWLHLYGKNINYIFWNMSIANKGSVF